MSRRVLRCCANLCATRYNALGSTVMNTRYDGTVTNDILFYPWGQGWAAPVNDYLQFFGSIPNWDWERVAQSLCF